MNTITTHRKHTYLLLLIFNYGILKINLKPTSHLPIMISV
jgi:hypothetical protein